MNHLQLNPSYLPSNPVSQQQKNFKLVNPKHHPQIRRGAGPASPTPPRSRQLEPAHSLDAEGDERNADHQQVQDVEIVPAEGALVEEGPVGSHLQGGTWRHKQTLPSAAAQEPSPPGYAEGTTGEGALLLLLADNLPPDPQGELEPPWKEKRVKKIAR